MFRVIAYNRFGVSCPSYTDEDVSAITMNKVFFAIYVVTNCADVMCLHGIQILFLARVFLTKLIL
jgi:hypothetical protein